MIRIVRGTYGLRNGKIIVPKTVKDNPFSINKAEEERLVKLGVAEFVTETEAKAEVEETKETETEAKELDKEALIERYKELGLGGNPANWKAETILKKIEEAEATLEEETPDLNSDDGVVE